MDDGEVEARSQQDGGRIVFEIITEWPYMVDSVFVSTWPSPMRGARLGCVSQELR